MISNKTKLPSNLKAIVFDWGDTLMLDFRDKKGPMYLWDKVEVVQGIPAFLEKAALKFKLYVGSNSGESNTEMMVKALERGGIAKHFTVFFASTDMLYAKPDPRFFQTIAHEIKIKENQIAMCGNDPDKDIRAAKKAGLFTFFYTATHPHEIPKEADIIFDSFTALKAYFE